MVSSGAGGSCCAHVFDTRKVIQRYFDVKKLVPVQQCECTCFLCFLFWGGGGVGHKPYVVM